MTIHEILADLKSDRKKKIVLDTDAFNEIDDQYAIAYCYLSEKMELLAIHAAPFMHERCDSMAKGMEQSYEEILKVMSLTDPDYSTPVLRGSTTTVHASGAAVESEAADNLIKLAHESDEIIYVLAIGAITNVVSAIMKDPTIKEKICVVWLGCNQLHVSDPVEYNLEQDYKGGQYLLDCGVPLVIVPAGWVTSALRSDIENARLLRGANAICDYLCDITEERWRMVGSFDGWYRTIWDLGAPAIFETPECAEFEIVHAPILTDERKYAFDDSRHEIIMVQALDRDPIFARAWDILKKGR